MQKFILSAIALTFAAQSWAALPPYWQRAKELASIANDGTVSKLVADAIKEGATGLVDKLERLLPSPAARMKGPVYRVTSGACHTDVVVVYEPSRLIGAAKYRLETDTKMLCSKPYPSPELSK